MHFSYIYSNAWMMTENGDFRVVCRNVSIELLLIEIPLDAIKVISFQVVVALEDRLMAFEGMWRYDRIREQFDTKATCKKISQIQLRFKNIKGQI